MVRTTNKRWFYGLMAVLNVAVGVMFLTVNIRPSPPSVMATIVTVSRPRPVIPRVIPAIVGIPTRIIIPSLSIDLAVDVGSYNPADNSWTVGATKAYYADMSMPLNNSNGSTLIYGHAQPQVFGRLPQIQPQSEALVYTDTGYLFTYRYQSVKNVLPTDTSVFTASGAPTLVLQTCAGDWDAYRALFSFALLSEEKI
jgi:LPXTG-site transpeptidase (sortase) family protein